MDTMRQGLDLLLEITSDLDILMKWNNPGITLHVSLPINRQAVMHAKPSFFTQSPLRPHGGATEKKLCWSM